LSVTEWQKNCACCEIKDELWHEKLIEPTYPIFMNACGFKLDA